MMKSYKMRPKCDRDATEVQPWCDRSVMIMTNDQWQMTKHQRFRRKKELSLYNIAFISISLHRFISDVLIL